MLPGLVRTDFFRTQGMSDPAFSDDAYLSAEQVVDATLAGIASGETIVVPGLADTELLARADDARSALFQAILSGGLAPRYAMAGVSRPSCSSSTRCDAFSTL